MTDTVLELSNLAVAFDAPGDDEAVRGVSFSIARGECLGIVGESGSGKSQIFPAAFGLASENARVSGSVKFSGVEMIGLPRKELDNIRGRHVAFVFQDSGLTPHMTIAAQMSEVLRRHFHLRGAEARVLVLQWLERVRIAGAPSRLQQYPHELSGGVRQRVTIAMAMMCGPALLIADEPTGALDAIAQAQTLDLIDDLRKETHAAMALITRDLGVIARMAQRVVVMKQGEVVEIGAAEDIYAAPKAEYTRALLKAAPRIDGDRMIAVQPAGEGEPILAADDVRVHFPVKVGGGLFGRTKFLRAVDGVSLSMHAGETLGVIGESGAGKSTLARTLVQLLPRTAGAVSFLGRDLLPREREAVRQARRDLQVVFQDPFASLDPRMTLGDSVAEPLLAFAPELGRSQREARVTDMMRKVGLDPGLIDRYPRDLSGGQNQRAGIARAMILKPRLVVCDEAVSALDGTARAQILRLLAELQRDFRTSFLFISRDLAVVREVSHNVLVLYLGRAVEYGSSELLLRDPHHPYTRALLAASLTPDPARARERPHVRLDGEALSPLDTRATLRFLSSRLIDDPEAVQYRPQWLEVAPGHFVAEYDEQEDRGRLIA